MLPTSRPSRRAFLTAIGGLSAAALTACSTAPTDTGGGPRGAGSAGTAGGGSTGGSGPLKWWDQFAPLEALNKATFEAFASSGGAQVEHTVYNPNEQGQALQLAFSSQQLPDVFTLAGVGVSASTLRGQGWFSAFTNADEVRKAVPANSLIEGLHVFDGQVYSLPLFSPRQYDGLLWWSKAAVTKAGLDPTAAPASWDDLRAAARKVQASGTAGIILPLQFTDRMAAFVVELAQTAGFPGASQGGATGIDLSTGEYAYHHDAFVSAIEFLLSFQTDKTLFAASTSLDARAGRARWAAGGSAFVFDGPYNPGVVVKDFAAFADQLVVGAIPTPDGSAPTINRAPSGGTYWISGQSDQIDQASALLTRTVGADYQAGLANAMDQPPLDLAAVASSDAHPTYKQAIEFFADQVSIAPAPQARKGVPAAEAAMGTIEPGLGQIVQGAFSGQVTDVRGALKKLSDQLTQAREEAVAKVGDGLGVDAWAFPDWKPGTDFDAAGYGG